MHAVQPPELVAERVIDWSGVPSTDLVAKSLSIDWLTWVHVIDLPVDLNLKYVLLCHSCCQGRSQDFTLGDTEVGRWRRENRVSEGAEGVGNGDGLSPSPTHQGIWGSVVSSFI